MPTDAAMRAAEIIVVKFSQPQPYPIVNAIAEIIDREMGRASSPVQPGLPTMNERMNEIRSQTGIRVTPEVAQQIRDAPDGKIVPLNGPEGTMGSEQSANPSKELGKT